MLLCSRDLAQVLFGTSFLLLTEVEMLAGRPVCTVTFTRVTEVSTDLCSTTFKQETNFKSVVCVSKAFFAFSVFSAQVPVMLP